MIISKKNAFKTLFTWQKFDNWFCTDLHTDTQTKNNGHFRWKISLKNAIFK